jgi:hypothetical protein
LKRQITLALFLVTLCRAQAELRVPAFTAYLEPDSEGARVSQQSGISNWKDPALKVLWLGEIKMPGQIFTRPATGQPPADFTPPDIPEQ